MHTMPAGILLSYKLQDKIMAYGVLAIFIAYNFHDLQNNNNFSADLGVYCYESQHRATFTQLL